MQQLTIELQKKRNQKKLFESIVEQDKKNKTESPRDLVKLIKQLGAEIMTIEKELKYRNEKKIRTGYTNSKNDLDKMG